MVGVGGLENDSRKRQLCGVLASRWRWTLMWVCLDSCEERAGEGRLESWGNWELRLKVDYLLEEMTWTRSPHTGVSYIKLVLRVRFQGFCLWKLELRSFLKVTKPWVLVRV